MVNPLRNFLKGLAERKNRDRILSLEEKVDNLKEAVETDYEREYYMEGRIEEIDDDWETLATYRMKASGIQNKARELRRNVTNILTDNQVEYFRQKLDRIVEESRDIKRGIRQDNVVLKMDMIERNIEKESNDDDNP